MLVGILTVAAAALLRSDLGERLLGYPPEREGSRSPGVAP